MLNYTCVIFIYITLSAAKMLSQVITELIIFEDTPVWSFKPFKLFFHSELWSNHLIVILLFYHAFSPSWVVLNICNNMMEWFYFKMSMPCV